MPLPYRCAIPSSRKKRAVVGRRPSARRGFSKSYDPTRSNPNDEALPNGLVGNRHPAPGLLVGKVSKWEGGRGGESLHSTRTWKVLGQRRVDKCVCWRSYAALCIINRKNNQAKTPTRHAASSYTRRLSVFTSPHNTMPCCPRQTTKDGDHAGRWDGTCVSRAFELVICKPVGDDAQRPILQRRQRTDRAFLSFRRGGYRSPCFFRSFCLISRALHAPEGWLGARRVGKEHRALVASGVWLGVAD